MYDNRIKANKPTDNESTGLFAFILIFICYSIITTESAENRLLQHNSFEHRVRPSMHEPPMFEGYRFCCPIPMKAFAIGCPTRCKNKITDSFSVDICFIRAERRTEKCCLTDCFFGLYSLDENGNDCTEICIFFNEFCVLNRIHLITCIFKLMLIFIDIDNIIICVEFYFTTLDCLLQ